MTDKPERGQQRVRFSLSMLMSYDAKKYLSANVEMEGFKKEHPRRPLSRRLWYKQR